MTIGLGPIGATAIGSGPIGSIFAPPPPFIPSGKGTPSQAMADALKGLGFIGGLADLQHQWFDTLAIEQGALDDRWKEYLDVYGAPDGAMASRRVYLYKDFLGLPQSTDNFSINELKRAFWLAL